MFPDYMRDALTWVALYRPFWLGIVYALKLVEDNRPEERLWTDGTHLGVNPKFFKSLPPKLKAVAIIHEAIHVAYEHSFRREGRDEKVYGRAVDEVTNNMLVDDGLPIGNDWICDRAYRGMSVETVYELLLKKQKEEPQQGQGQGKPQQGATDIGGDVRDAPGDAEEVKERLQEVRQAVIRAVEGSGIGYAPAGLERHVEKLVTSPVRWQEVLLEFARRMVYSDWNWSRPDRRYAFHMCAPSIGMPVVGRIVVAVDTSGSIGSMLLGKFEQEIRTIQYECRPRPLTTFYFDTRIYDPRDWEPDEEPVKLKPRGGGGTSFVPIFRFIDSLEEEPAALIVLTDMAGTFPSGPPAYPVLWASVVPNVQPPFGEFVHVHTGN